MDDEYSGYNQQQNQQDSYADYERQRVEEQIRRDSEYNQFDTYRGTQNTSNMQEYFVAEERERQRLQQLERDSQSSSVKANQDSNQFSYDQKSDKPYYSSSSPSRNFKGGRRSGGRYVPKLSKEEKATNEQIQLYNLKLKNALTKSEVIKIKLERELSENPTVDPDLIKQKYQSAIDLSNKELEDIQTTLYSFQEKKDKYKEMRNTLISQPDLKFDGNYKELFNKYMEPIGRMTCGVGGTLSATVGTFAAFSTGATLATVAWPAFVAIGAVGIMAATLTKKPENELEKSRMDNESNFKKFLRVGASNICQKAGLVASLTAATGAVALAVTSSGFAIAALGSLALVGFIAHKQKEQQNKINEEYGVNIGNEVKYITPKEEVKDKINKLREQNTESMFHNVNLKN